MEEALDGVAGVFGYIQAYFLHGLDHDGIQLTWFQSRAFGFETSCAKFVQERLRHLRAGTVVNADEKNSFHVRIECRANGFVKRVDSDFRT